MPMAAPAPVGRPPNMAKPRTPPLATQAAQSALSPITTKVAMIPKEAGKLSDMGKATARGLRKAKYKIQDAGDWVADRFRRDPPAPQLSGLTAGAAGAGLGGIAGGTVGALGAKEGDRMNAFTRNAVLGAGLGTGAGLMAKAPVNEILSQRHANKLIAAKQKARELKRGMRKTAISLPAAGAVMGGVMGGVMGRSPKMALMGAGIGGATGYAHRDELRGIGKATRGTMNVALGAGR